jgi:hypothetical protein
MPIEETGPDIDVMTPTLISACADATAIAVISAPTAAEFSVRLSMNLPSKVRPAD